MKKIALVFLLASATQACQTTREVPIDIPEITMTVQPSTPVKQVKTGVEMSIVAPQVELKTYSDRRLGKQNAGASALRIMGPDIYPVESWPVYYPSASKIIFKVRIKNNLQKPFRLNGAVAAIEMDKKIVSASSSDLIEPQELRFDKNHSAPSSLGIRGIISDLGRNHQEELWNGLTESDVSEFQREIILPGKEKEVSIAGPRHVNVPSEKNCSINILDVTTETDSASNATKKDNFSWIVTYKRTKTSKNHLISVESKPLIPSERAELEFMNSAH